MVRGEKVTIKVGPLTQEVWIIGEGMLRNGTRILLFENDAHMVFVKPVAQFDRPKVRHGVQSKVHVLADNHEG